jgi:hypothetical protein
MKFTRLGAARLPILVLLVSACSSPPSPPAQAAVSLSITPASGQICNHTQPMLSLPSKSSASVIAEIGPGCDLSTGCKPDDYIVVNQDRGTTVACTVSPSGGNYNVQLSVNVDGSATGDLSMQFVLNGTLMPTGGAGVTVNSSSQYSGSNGIDSNCTVTIAPPHGVIAKGKIWGSFQCNAFRDPTNIGDTGCLAEGYFLFENCDG